MVIELFEMTIKQQMLCKSGGFDKFNHRLFITKKITNYIKKI